MWHIDRNTAPRASVVAEPEDTLVALAERIGLQADEADAWLQRSTASGEIPNTIVFLWVGDLGAMGKLAVRWNGEMRFARALGFHIIELDFRFGHTDIEALDLIAGLSQRGELHGLVVTGHGSPAGFGTGGISAHIHRDGWYLSYAEIDEALRYRLGIVILNACLSGYSHSDREIRTSRNFLCSRVEPDYELLAGGRDLVANSPAARFYGHTRILYPVIEGGRLRRILSPGDQGTRIG